MESWRVLELDKDNLEFDKKTFLVSGHPCGHVSGLGVPLWAGPSTLGRSLCSGDGLFP